MGLPFVGLVVSGLGLEGVEELAPANMANVTGRKGQAVVPHFMFVSCESDWIPRREFIPARTEGATKPEEQQKELMIHHDNHQ